MSINKTVVDLVSREPLALSASEQVLASHSPTTLDVSYGSGFPFDSFHLHHPDCTMFTTTHRLVLVSNNIDFANTKKDGVEFETFSININSVRNARIDGAKLFMKTELQDHEMKLARVELSLCSEYDTEAAHNLITKSSMRIKKD